MSPEEAAGLLHDAVALNGFGTFNESQVAAIWHDGTQVPLGLYGDLQRAVTVLAIHHGLFRTLDGEVATLDEPLGRGLDDMAAGRLNDLGDFSRYLDDGT